MGFSKKLALFLLMLLALPQVLAPEHPVNSVVSAAEESVYPINGSDKSPHNIVGRINFSNGPSATGFVIGSDTILTNKHVANKLKDGITGTFTLGINYHNSGKKVLGNYELVSVIPAPNADDDVAIIKVKPSQDNLPLDKVVNPAKIVNANYIDEEWIKNSTDNQFHIAGYPGNKDRNIMWGSDGKLLKYVFNSNRIYEADIISVPGNSGSPLFNKNNEVVGIISSTYGHTTNHAGGFLFKDDLYDFIMANK